MPATILQTFPRFTDGLLLFESFESANFMANENWTLLNGVPSISGDVAQEGLKSLKMDTTYPQIEKTTAAFKFAVAYFYDDSAVVAGGFEPFALWETADGKLFGIGVDLTLTTTNYTKVINNVKIDSGIPRTTAFHRFTIKDTAGTVDVKLDGTSVGTFAIVTPLIKTRIGCKVYTGAPAFGYFDDIQVCQFADLIVAPLDAGQVVSVYTTAGVLVGQATATGGQATIDTTLKDSAFDGYITITRADGTRPFFRSATLSFSTGDRWALAVFSFGRRPGSIDVRPAATRQDKESNSGKNQSVFFFDRDIVSFTINELTEDEKNNLMRWWSTAQRGETFGCAIDDGATYYTTVTEAISSVATALVKPASLVGANKGSVLGFRTSTGQYRDTKKVVAISGAYFLMDSFFVSAFQIGDEIRDIYYWPFAITTDKALQVSLSNVRRKRWNATITFKEAL